MYDQQLTPDVSGSKGHTREPQPPGAMVFFIGIFMKKTGTNFKPLIEINIESKILLIRGKKVILDRDLAELYGVTSGNLNKAVRRNMERFPEDLMFQVLKDEYDSLGSQFGILKKVRHSKYLPKAFTREGIDILPGVLKSKRSIEANVQIIGTFNRLKEILLTNKYEYFREAFDLACNKKGDLSELDTRIFLDVMQLIGNDTVEQIENFSASNKGILLIGEDYDLLNAAAAYIWYTHPLWYFVSGNKCIENEWERSCLLHKDFTGCNEEEIRTSLFRQPEGLMEACKYGKILFLRDINAKHVDILERIARAIRGFKRYREGGESCWNEYESNIIILNAKQAKKLPGECLRQFEPIELELGNAKKVQTVTGGKKRNSKNYTDNKKYMRILKDVLSKYNLINLDYYPSVPELRDEVKREVDLYNKEIEDVKDEKGKLKKKINYKPHSIETHIQDHEIRRGIMELKRKLEEKEGKIKRKK